jgi:2-polyprenyl-3-methyl-5-hydroxy-6-metoxy-1,4-benzoquinol methylase
VTGPGEDAEDDGRVEPDFAAILDYEAQPKEFVRCNLCAPDALQLAQWEDYGPDRYGYRVGVVTCKHCGLVYISPRLTKEAYARFYADGTYRKLVSAFHGREINAQTIQPEQLVYAMELADFIGPYIGKAETLLDIGGSTGVVAGYLAERFALVGTVLDPATQELERAHGLLKIQSTVEDWEPNGRTWDVITLCQTVDHLLDIAGTLRKVKSALAPGGHFFVDFVDYERTRTIKIDHPFNLTKRTMREYLDRAGLGRAAELIDTTNIHVKHVCRA